MKKRIQKILSLLTAVTIVYSMGGYVSAEQSWTNDDSAEITILVCGDNTPNEDNLVIQELEKKTNTNINIIYITYDDRTTKLNTMIAAGDAPDIFYMKVDEAAALKEAGVLADMTDVLNTVGTNVLEETKDILNIVSLNNDGIYMIPNTSTGYSTNVNIRTDWLENLGLEMPTNLDSFAEVMHAFTYNDPDGNGKDDTFGYSFNLNTLTEINESGSNIFGAFGIAKGRPMQMEDGTVTSWVKHPNFLEAIKYLKNLVDDGVCEPDYVTIPNLSMFEKLWIGTSGCMEWECVGPTNNWMPGRYTEDPAPTFDFAILEGPYGDHGTAANYPKATEGWVFSASCENLEGAARIANYLMTEEGSDLLYLGVEGVMYDWVDKEEGIIERIGEYKDDATHRANGAFCYWELFTPSNNAELRTLNSQTKAGVQMAANNKIDWAYVTSTSEVYSECGADMDQLIKEMVAELLVTDEADMQAVYEEYLAEWEAIGGSDWEVEMTELWKAQNS